MPFREVVGMSSASLRIDKNHGFIFLAIPQTTSEYDRSSWDEGWKTIHQRVAALKGQRSFRRNWDQTVTRTR